MALPGKTKMAQVKGTASGEDSQVRGADCPPARPADPNIGWCPQRFCAPWPTRSPLRFVTRHPEGLLHFETSSQLHVAPLNGNDSPAAFLGEGDCHHLRRV